ncbi:sigma-70 family RNA polymerase sigma factor [Rossellomorea vietnamensis]|uniref:Sigma-70 family RNA polymerase sigma factor n=1 Tax=Rossellomorea vietnamensis TaxID=218284 RepID=A0A5D4M9J0_9BACI|nr:sigma-70 family RNA polymerase sigma factor [Rossellomorea vietnamensis]TYR98604.1 sigma-70 family RNA polymerase sigma factor [Rossellomorea vietnamensis]
MPQLSKVKKAKRGNDKAFQELVEEEKNKLYRMAYLYVKNENDAIDIVHETIYKAYVSIKKLKEPDYFTTWLTKILINTALDYIKKNKNIIPFDEIERYETNEKVPIAENLDLVDALDRLEEKYKTVIILRYYKGLQVNEIANMLDCPEGTVKTNLHRAINKLRIDLREECM